jgi:hypothetical protein
MKILKKLFCLTLLSSVSVFSQERADIKITFSGYLETFYANDFQNSNTEKKIAFHV